MKCPQCNKNEIEEITLFTLEDETREIQQEKLCLECLIKNISDEDVSENDEKTKPSGADRKGQS